MEHSSMLWRSRSNYLLFCFDLTIQESHSLGLVGQGWSLIKWWNSPASTCLAPPSPHPSAGTLFHRKHFFPSPVGWVMKAGALIPVWSPNSQGNFTSRTGERGILSCPLWNRWYKEVFFVSVPLMARRGPWGSYSSTHHLSNQLVVLKGEAPLAFVSEMRVHSSRRDIVGYPQAEK